jgi:hypothetical protein
LNNYSQDYFAVLCGNTGGRHDRKKEARTNSVPISFLERRVKYWRGELPREKSRKIGKKRSRIIGRKRPTSREIVRVHLKMVVLPEGVKIFFFYVNFIWLHIALVFEIVVDTILKVPFESCQTESCVNFFDVKPLFGSPAALQKARA